MAQSPPNNENPLLFRAVGRLQGIFSPGSDDKPQLGTLILEDGTQLSAYRPNFVEKKASKHSLPLDQPHLWTVYPNTHQGGEIKRVTLRNWLPTPPKTIQVNHFNIRGIVKKRIDSPEGIIVTIKRNFQPPPEEKEKSWWRPFQLILLGKNEPFIPKQFWEFTVIRQGTLMVIKEAQLVDDRGYTGRKNEPPQLKKSGSSVHSMPNY